MKQLLSLFLLSTVIVSAQVEVELQKIGFYPDVLTTDAVDSYSKELLISRLDDIILQNGVGDIGNHQFVLLAKVISIDESFTATTPPLYKVVYDIQLIVADMLAKKKFDVYNIYNCVGINRDKQKTKWQALRRIRSDRATTAWLKAVKEKIIDYYKNSCYLIIMKADVLNKQSKYDQAIELLSKMPKVSEQCFLIAQNKMTEVFKQKNLYEKIDINEVSLMKESDNITSQQIDSLSLLKVEMDSNTSKQDYDWVIEAE